MNDNFIDYSPKEWIKQTRGPIPEDGHLIDLLTDEEKEDKFFLNLVEIPQSYNHMAIEAGAFISYDTSAFLLHLGPLSTKNAWQYNILHRAILKEIKPVAWAEEGWWRESHARWDHMAYVSTKDQSKIVYTPSEKHGKADRQVMIKPGKYLNQNFSATIDTNTIRFWANRHSELYGEHTLRFALTGDDIEWVYEHGPISCMVMDRDNRYIQSETHPVRVYESPDIAIGYLLKKGKTDRVMARTVINTKCKEWTTIYGDQQVLESILRDQGYTPGGLEGCRLKVIQDTKYPHYDLCPYLDGDSTGIDYYREDNQTWLKVSNYGDFTADTTSGYLGENEDEETFYCECCQEDRPEDDRMNTFRDGYVCQGCVEEYYIEARYHVGSSYSDFFRENDIEYVQVYVQVSQTDIVQPWFRETLEAHPDYYLEYKGQWMSHEYFEAHHPQQEEAA